MERIGIYPFGPGGSGGLLSAEWTFWISLYFTDSNAWSGRSFHPWKKKYYGHSKKNITNFQSFYLRCI